MAGKWKETPLSMFAAAVVASVAAEIQFDTIRRYYRLMRSTKERASGPVQRRESKVAAVLAAMKVELEEERWNVVESVEVT